MGTPARGYKTMRTDLPEDVWERFAAEAAARGVKPATLLRNLIVARDKKKHVSEASDTSPNKREK